jgi:serine/threonine protein kinase
MTADRKTLKISDFGISTQRLVDKSVSGSGVRGTPWYMAPEVIDCKPYSTKADIWSFACLAMHLITGRRPFQGTNHYQALIQMSTQQHPLVGLPDEHKSLIKKMRNLNHFFLSCFKKEASRRLSAL